MSYLLSSARRSAPAVLGALLLAGLAGCGDSDAESRAGTRDEPVVVEHQFGTTEIDTVPERIVTIDLPWTDIMLAMGTDPVGYAVDQFMPESGVPWQELPADAQALSLVDGLPLEQVAALDPDLIVGTYSITSEQEYELLSQIAPTIAGLDPEQVQPWQELVGVAGEILDEPERAEGVVASVDRAVATVADDLPGLKGQTFALAQYVVGESVHIVADEQDGSSVFFEQLGMTIYPPVLREGERTGDTRVTVATERADLLRSDLLAFLVNGGGESDLADIPGFDQLPGTVAVLDYPTIVGLNTPSPLSIPYALEKMRPYLEDAASTVSS